MSIADSFSLCSLSLELCWFLEDPLLVSLYNLLFLKTLSLLDQLSSSVSFNDWISFRVLAFITDDICFLQIIEGLKEVLVGMRVGGIVWIFNHLYSVCSYAYFTLSQSSCSWLLLCRNLFNFFGLALYFRFLLS